MTVGQFADAYRSGRLSRTDAGWSYAPSESEAGRVVTTGPITESKTDDGDATTLDSYVAVAWRLLDR